jgi:hypothetical protein
MPKNTFLEFVPPMLAESAKSPFDSPDWIFQIKVYGYRAITVFDAASRLSHLTLGVLTERTATRFRDTSPVFVLPILVAVWCYARSQVQLVSNLKTQ